MHANFSQGSSKKKKRAGPIDVPQTCLKCDLRTLTSDIKERENVRDAQTRVESFRLQAYFSDGNDLRPRAEDFNKDLIYLFVRASGLTCFMTQPYMCDNCLGDLGV